MPDMDLRLVFESRFKSQRSNTLMIWRGENVIPLVSVSAITLPDPD